MHIDISVSKKILSYSKIFSTKCQHIGIWIRSKTYKQHRWHRSNNNMITTQTKRLGNKQTNKQTNKIEMEYDTIKCVYYV